MFGAEARVPLLEHIHNPRKVNIQVNTSEYDAHFFNKFFYFHKPHKPVQGAESQTSFLFPKSWKKKLFLSVMEAFKMCFKSILGHSESFWGTPLIS